MHPTPCAFTPNGQHYYLKHTRQVSRAIRFAPELDLISNGYIVAPPSSIDDKEYCWMEFLDPFTNNPDEPPDWIIEKLQKHKQGAENPTSKPTEPIQEAKPGELLCPLLKYNKQFDTGPGEAPEPGKRNEFTFRTALTHFMLGLEEQLYRAIYFEKVWPKMKTGDNGRGKFTGHEASQTIKSAKQLAKKLRAQGKTLPAKVIAYHRYKEKTAQGKGTGRRQRRRRWKCIEVMRGILRLVDRRPRTYHTGQDGEEAMGLIADDVAEIMKRPGTIPRRTLCRALKKLRERGMVEAEWEREGSGFVLYSLEKYSPRTNYKGASVPVPLSNRSIRPNQREKLRANARSGEDQRGEPPGPPKTGPPEDIQSMLQGEEAVSVYPGLCQLRKNCRAKRRSPGAATACHAVAWATDDPDLATWLYREKGAAGLWPVLKELGRHWKSIENPGGWLRKRLKNKTYA